jgi:hypothetical protein
MSSFDFDPTTRVANDIFLPVAAFSEHAYEIQENIALDIQVLYAALGFSVGNGLPSGYEVKLVAKGGPTAELLDLKDEDLMSIAQEAGLDDDEVHDLFEEFENAKKRAS